MMLRGDTNGLVKSRGPVCVAMGGGRKANMGLETGFQSKFIQGRKSHKPLFALLLYVVLDLVENQCGENYSALHWSRQRTYNLREPLEETL